MHPITEKHILDLRDKLTNKLLEANRRGECGGCFVKGAELKPYKVTAFIDEYELEIKLCKACTERLQKQDEQLRKKIDDNLPDDNI